MLTPQANTTVEPELWTLLPSGHSLVNARLVSDQPTIEKRLIDYTGRFEKTARRFANAPITCIAAACTGASYLIGPERETKIVDEMQSYFRVPFLTAALSTVSALNAMGSKKLLFSHHILAPSMSIAYRTGKVSVLKSLQWLGQN